MGIDALAVFPPGAGLSHFAFDFACWRMLVPGFDALAVLLQLFPERSDRDF